jgi:hypothetical protein
MATTTPNYGWTVPTSTDLVKDGATAIETLGDAIDASMNTALGTKKAGMVLLNTTSFSAVAAVSLTADTFTTTYNNYRLHITLTAKTVSDSVNIRLRAAGTDATGSNYVRSGFEAKVGTFGNISSAATTLWDLGSVNSAAANRTLYALDIANIKLAQPTVLTGTAAVQDPTNFAMYGYSFLHDLATAYDSLTIYVTSGTFTGSVSVYGYNK